jgi:alpha-D-ribose 1-methylphosphonate 5-triphosphate synthase subunit PhnH
MSPGFTDPAQQSQRAFRAILDALAHPTRPFSIAGPVQPPRPLSSAAAAIGLTLCDADTPVFLDAALTADGTDGTVAAWFAFQTGAPVHTDHTQAVFVFATGFERLPPLADLAAGTHEQPHRSATVVLDLAGPGPRRDGPEEERLRATGPGINGHSAFSAPRGFVEVWHRNTSRFPLGVDFLLVEDAQVTGLPRTTRLEGAA